MKQPDYLSSGGWRRDLLAVNTVLRDASEQLLAEYDLFGGELDHYALKMARATLLDGFSWLDRALERPKALQETNLGPAPEPRSLPRV